MTEYSLEQKARVIADYELGMSKSAIARKYGIPRTNVIAWVQGHEPAVPTVSDSEQRERLGELVYEFLTTGFEALIAQNRLAADDKYLRLESTSFAAVYGTVHAGVLAVAQAIDRGESGEGLPLQSGRAGPAN